MAASNGAICSYEHSPPLTFSAAGGGSSSNSESLNIETDHHQPSDNAAKRSRGRPKGSKNKLKPPILVPRDNVPTMKPVILEIAPGFDIVESIVTFARSNNVGVGIISATGFVSSVTLLQYSTSHGSSRSIAGYFALLSLSGSFTTATTPPCCSFAVTLAGIREEQHGQVFGGIVSGNITAATQVVVVVATFATTGTPVHKLPYGGGATESMGVYGVAASTQLGSFNGPGVMMPWGPSMN